MEQLRRLVDEQGSQRAAARALGNVNLQSSIVNALAGIRLPSEALRRALDEYEEQQGVECQCQS